MHRMVTNFLVGLGLLSLMAGFPALAEEPHRAQGVFCETLDQARTFLETYDGTNRTEALKTANGTESYDNACGLADVFILQVEQYDEVKAPTGTWTLVQVLVVGQAEQHDGWVSVTIVQPPRPQFTAFLIEPPVVGTSI